MFYTTNPIIKHKACLPNLAEELTNVLPNHWFFTLVLA